MVFRLVLFFPLSLFLDARRFLDGGTGSLTFWVVFWVPDVALLLILLSFVWWLSWDTAPVVRPRLIVAEDETGEGKEGGVGKKGRRKILYKPIRQENAFSIYLSVALPWTGL